MEDHENRTPFTRPDPRPLSDVERALLEWLMANGRPETEQYASQLSSVRVVGGCTCGCPTVDLATQDRKERTVGPSHVLADFGGVTAEGIQVGVILHARQGQLSELEIYAESEVDGPFGLPTIESLKK